jgi:hypothetical protein
MVKSLLLSKLQYFSNSGNLCCDINGKKKSFLSFKIKKSRVAKIEMIKLQISNEKKKIQHVENVAIFVSLDLKLYVS